MKSDWSLKLITESRFFFSSFWIRVSFAGYTLPFDGYLGLSMGPEFIPVGKVALNGLGVMSGAIFISDKEKAFNILMGIGFSIRRGPSGTFFGLLQCRFTSIRPMIIGRPQENTWMVSFKWYRCKNCRS